MAGFDYPEDQEKFVKMIARKIIGSRKKKAKKKEPGLKATESAIEKRRRRMREELHGTSK
jgi:hypothetical protein